MEERLYRSSGKLSPLFFLLFVLLVPIAAALLSIAYIYVIYYIPSVYLNVFIAIGCGMLCGMLIPVKSGKMRCKPVAVIGGLIAVLLMKYLMWLVYIPLIYSKVYQQFDYNFLDCLRLSAGLFFDPMQVSEFIREINEFGVWSIRKLDVNGVLLYIVWFAELCIFAVSCIMTVLKRSQRPYSEEAGKWFKAGSRKVETDMPERSDKFKDQLISGDDTELRELVSHPKSRNDSFLRISYYYLDDLPYGYLSADAISHEKNRKGRDKEKSETVAEYVRVDYSIISALKALSERTPSNAPAEETAQ